MLPILVADEAASLSRNGCGCISRKRDDLQTMTSMRIEHFRKVLAVFLAAGALIAGCDREADVAAEQTQRMQGKIDVPGPEQQPEFLFPEHVRSSDATLNKFIEDFARACIAGHYDQYRLFTSRQVEPVPREQFEKVYRRVERVEVRKVEALVRISGLPYPLWLIITDIHLRETPREPIRTTMILVFKEQDKWVMAPAPVALRDAIAATRPATTRPATRPTSAPASSK
jgi:hypothetical protein